jgi:hypothetical protein
MAHARMKWPVGKILEDTHMHKRQRSIRSSHRQAGMVL